MILVVGDLVDDIGVRPLEAVNLHSDTRSEIRMTPGGSAANTAAWLGFLGTSTRFFGKTGTDGIARHGDALRDFGVDPRIVADPELPTATIVLTLDADGDRTMYVDRAANGSLAIDDIPDDLFDDVTWLHVSGYTFYDPATRPVALELLERAKARGISTSVDPSSEGFLRDASVESFMEWTRGVDMIFPNLDEARLLVGATGPFIDFDVLTAAYPHVVVTLGGTGAAYVGTAGREQVTGARVPVLDTTGAGDAFAAGFLSSWLASRDPKTALTAGNGAGQRCIQMRGARP